MRIVCISDTHSLHDQIEGIPHGDVLIHAGDLTGSGRIPAGFEAVEWLSQLPHRHKILIAGNHDFCFEDYGAWMREHCERCEIIYLEDESTVIDGVKFYGSPWTPRFRGMAYNADPALAAEKMKLVPADTDVLVTHGPPRGIMDYVPSDDVHVGCLSVEARIPFLKSLKAHVFGHIHEGYGILEKGGVVYVNASTCTERYKPTNPPIVIDI